MQQQKDENLTAAVAAGACAFWTGIREAEVAHKDATALAIRFGKYKK